MADWWGDWQNYWSGDQYPVGSTTDWYGGQLNRVGQDTARYIGDGGATTYLNSSWDPGQAAYLAYKYPQIKSGWDQDYGVNWWEGLDITSPLTGAPINTGWNKSDGTAGGGGGAPGTAPGAGGSASPFAGIDIGNFQDPWSYSGMRQDWVDALGGAPLDNLLNLISPGGFQSNLQGAVEGATGTIQDQITQSMGTMGQTYNQAGQSLDNLFQQQLDPAIQQSMNSLSARGMLGDGDIKRDVLSQTYSNVAAPILGMQTQLAGAGAGAQGNLLTQGMNAIAGLLGKGAGMQMAFPALLGDMVLQGGQFSESQDPSAAYDILASMLPVLMNYGIPTAGGATTGGTTGGGSSGGLLAS